MITRVRLTSSAETIYLKDGVEYLPCACGEMHAIGENAEGYPLDDTRLWHEHMCSTGKSNPLARGLHDDVYLLGPPAPDKEGWELGVCTCGAQVPILRKMP